MNIGKVGINLAILKMRVTDPAAARAARKLMRDEDAAEVLISVAETVVFSLNDERLAAAYAAGNWIAFFQLLIDSLPAIIEAVKAIVDLFNKGGGFDQEYIAQIVASCIEQNAVAV
jgi:hypothetical protein